MTKAALALQKENINIDWSESSETTIEALATLAAGFKWQRDELAALLNIELHKILRDTDGSAWIIEIVENSWDTLQQQEEELS
jgi:hypothetical protein